MTKYLQRNKQLTPIQVLEKTVGIHALWNKGLITRDRAIQSLRRLKEQYPDAYRQYALNPNGH